MIPTLASPADNVRSTRPVGRGGPRRPPTSRPSAPDVPARRRYFRPHSSDWHAPAPRRRVDAHGAPTGSGGADIPPHARVACWTTRTQWLITVRCALAAPEGAAALTRHHIRLETVICVAKADAAAADVATGRSVTTAHATAARQIGCSAKTVQRARQVLADLGLAVITAVGRYLNSAERAAARAAGLRQDRMASTRHLTTPKHWARHAADQNVHLPRSGSFQRNLTRSVVTKRKRRQGQVAGHGHGLAMQRLAAKIVARASWLAGGRHLGALMGVLAGEGIDPARTSATRILEAIDRAGGGWMTPSDQKHPLAWLRWGLRRAERHHLHYDTPTRATTATAAPTGPCGHPDCDGHGWHNTCRGDGTPIATRCPVRPVRG